MKEASGLYQVVVIVDSLLILALLAAALVQPRFQSLLPLAGLLAGLSAALQSRTLVGLEPGLRRLLLVAGLVAVVFAAIVLLLPHRS
jgi:hypothetical protein